MLGLQVIDQPFVLGVGGLGPAFPGAQQCVHVDPGRGGSAEIVRRSGQQGPRITPRVGKRLPGALRGFRIGTQALHFGFGPRPPCGSQLAGTAHRARAIAMCRMQGKRALQQIRDLPSAAGIGSLGSAVRLRRGAQPGRRGLHLVGTRHRKGRESAQQGDLTLAFRFDRALQNQLHGIEIPRTDTRPVDRLRTGPRPFIVERFYLCIPLAPSGLGGANLFVALASPLTQPPAGIHEGVEPPAPPTWCRTGRPVGGRGSSPTRCMAETGDTW